MIRILGRANSINVQKVMWTAAEVGSEVERQDVGGAFGGNDTPEYLTMNPNGRVPVLVEGDFVLWESQAIVRYLAENSGKAPWWAAKIEDRAHANQWMDFYINSLHAHMTAIFWGLIRTTPEKRDMAAIGKAIAEASKAWVTMRTVSPPIPARFPSSSGCR